MGLIWRVGGLFGCMLAAAHVAADEIYVCVDGKGRRLTSDRPIAECSDRDQKVFGNTGTVKRVVGKTLTAQEQADLDEIQRREAEEQAKIAEDKRRDRALYTRYPNEAGHQKARDEALSAVDAVMASASGRLAELTMRHKELESQLDLYRKDPTKVPKALRLKVEDNARNQAAQQRFLAEQDDEKKRINQRFDEEANKLRPRWTYQAPVTRTGASATGAAKAGH